MYDPVYVRTRLQLALAMAYRSTYCHVTSGNYERLARLQVTAVLWEDDVIWMSETLC